MDVIYEKILYDFVYIICYFYLEFEFKFCNLWLVYYNFENVEVY